MDIEMQRRQAAVPRFEGETLRLVETRYGYGVRAKRGAGVFFALEWAMRCVGASLIVAALAVWAIPEGWVLSETVVKGVVSGILGIGGGCVTWIAGQGFAQEVQINPRKREIELVTRNSFGRRKLRRNFTLRDLESFYVKRSKDPFELAGMFLRLRGAQELRVLRGTAAELSALHEIMCKDLQPAKARQVRRRQRDGAKAVQLVA